MLSRLFKVLPLVLFTSLAAAVYSYGTANDTECGPSKDYTESYKQGHPADEQQMTSGYNTPARIDVEGSWDFFLTGSFIYWQPRESGLDLGYYTIPTASGAGQVLNVDFEYKPGFKVGLGWNTNHDNWAFLAEYTWLKGKTKTNHTTPSNRSSTFNIWWDGDTSPTYVKASSDWRLTTHILDGDLLRAFYCGTNLTFKPFGGIRAYWIDQKYNARYTDASDNVYRGHHKSDSWAVGLRAGFYGNWLLGEGFRFIGNASGSLAYQHFKVDHKAYNSSNTLSHYYKNKIGHITPNIEAAAGLGWGTYFSDNGWHFDLSATYDFVYFWNQNVMRDLMNKVEEGVNSIGDLYFHGLTITLKLDF